MSALNARPAVFLDRDGTLIEERHYLADPGGVRLVPGAAGAVRALNEAGWLVVLTTNQAGVARGLFPESAVHAVHARVGALLAREGAWLDGIEFCPHHPDLGPPCDCRKPAPGMARRAAGRLPIDLAASWAVGDKRIDVAFGCAAGGRGHLVLTGYGPSERAEVEARHPDAPISQDLAGAVYLILGGTGPRRPAAEAT